MGSQHPSVRVYQEGVSTDGEDAVKILKIGKLKTDSWQSNVLSDWMQVDDENIWCNSVCGLSIPRQNGKTLTVSGRSIAGAIMRGEWIIYTAHLQKTATETFLEMRGICEVPKIYRYIREIKSAIGREQIIFQNGARIMFVARTRNGGRGFHGDVLIFDEAQELTSEQQASFLPALSASVNPQTIYLGTPPDENCDGTVFRKIRDNAKSEDNSKIAWTEFSVEEIGDVSDKSRWAETNPALGRRMRESTIESEFEQMPVDTFARERLGWWTPIIEHKEELVIDTENWQKCKSKEAKPNGKTAYGVQFSADGSQVALCGAVIPKDGKARISLIKKESTSRGIRWLSEWLNARTDKASCIVIDGRNMVETLIDQIKDSWKFKNSIIRISTRNVLDAVGMLTDAINEESLTWYEYQEDLDDSAKTSTKRPIGGGFGFGGENPLPIAGCALAYYGAKTSKRDPTRKMRIG